MRLKFEIIIFKNLGSNSNYISKYLYGFDIKSVHFCLFFYVLIFAAYRTVVKIKNVSCKMPCENKLKMISV